MTYDNNNKAYMSTNINGSVPSLNDIEFIFKSVKYKFINNENHGGLAIPSIISWFLLGFVNYVLAKAISIEGQAHIITIFLY